jgi:hypothetical protein
MAPSSSEVGQDGYMQVERVRPALRERLGREGSADLVDFLGYCRKEWPADVIGVVGDRFERRLAEETSKLRVEMAQGFAGVREDMARGFAELRGDLAHQRVDILKWVFVFWVGQFFATASVVVAVIRFIQAS